MFNLFNIMSKVMESSLRQVHKNVHLEDMNHECMNLSNQILNFKIFI